MFLGNSIECYQCHSERDPDCTSDVPDVRYLTNCSTLKKGPQYSACRKIENNVDFEVLGRKHNIFNIFFYAILCRYENEMKICLKIFDLIKRF